MRFRPRLSLFPVLCGAVIALSALLPSPQNGAILGLPSLCPFYNLSGLPCPGCGLTRAFVCCAHGQLAAAWEWHPLGPFLFGATLFYALSALLGRAVWQPSNRVLIFAALMGGICWVLRLGGVFPFPTA